MYAAAAEPMPASAAAEAAPAAASPAAAAPAAAAAGPVAAGLQEPTRIPIRGYRRCGDLASTCILSVPSHSTAHACNSPGSW
jgi:hypothetical protein